MDHAVLCVMAKAPRPGAVKTRLMPAVSAAAAAELATAFLLDTWRTASLAELGTAPVLVLAGSPHRLPRELIDVPIWPQAEGDLGARMEDAARRGLAIARAAVLIGTDAPGLPPALLRAAANALDTHDAVLGPALDGGYYLIGLRRCEPGLLAGLPWSSRQTLAATRSRLRRCGYSCALLPAWFDVDDEPSLSLLRLALASAAIEAPATAAALEALP